MAIAAFFANPVPGGKLRIAGGEYMVLRFDADDKCAILRKGQTGAVLVGTNSSICIGTHNEKQPAGDANNVSYIYSNDWILVSFFIFFFQIKLFLKLIE